MLETALKWLEVEVRRAYNHLQLANQYRDEYLTLYGIDKTTNLDEPIATKDRRDWLAQALLLLSYDDRAIALGYDGIASRASLTDSVATVQQATQELAEAEKAFTRRYQSKSIQAAFR
ncbi:MAG: hypothetical protein AAF702_05480 [Chloroflexota bacterium]